MAVGMWDLGATPHPPVEGERDSRAEEGQHRFNPHAWTRHTRVCGPGKTGWVLSGAHNCCSKDAHRPNDTTIDGGPLPGWRSEIPGVGGWTPPPPRGLPGGGGASVGDAEDPDGDVLDLLGREGGARLQPDGGGYRGDRASNAGRWGPSVPPPPPLDGRGRDRSSAEISQPLASTPAGLTLNFLKILSG